MNTRNLGRKLLILDMTMLLPSGYGCDVSDTFILPGSRAALSGCTVMLPPMEADLVRELIGSEYRITPRTMSSNGCWMTLSHLSDPPSSVLFPGLASRTSPTDDSERRLNGDASKISGESNSNIRPSSIVCESPSGSSTGSVPSSTPSRPR